KIIGNGTLIATSAVNPAAAGLAAWQILAIVTAQHYLAEINDRLAGLERAVEAIKDWLDNDRRAKLLGNLAWLRGLASNLQDQNVTDEQVSAYVHQLEAIDRECLQIMEAARLQMDSQEKAFRELQLGGFRESNFEPAKKVIQEHEGTAS